METYSVIIGGVLAIVSAGVAQWGMHLSNVSRERKKLIHEKAEEICEQVNVLTEWVGVRCYNTLALKDDQEFLPPINKLVALQNLYFREAEGEVANFAQRAVNVLNTLREAYPAMLQEQAEVNSARAIGGDVSSAIDKYEAVRKEMTVAINRARAAFVEAGTVVTRKIITLVHEKTK